MELMARFLILLSIVLIAASVAVAGRFRLPLKENSRIDVFFQRLQLLGIVIAAVAELALPLATGWLGVPALAYTAAALHIASLTVYRVKLPAVQGIRPRTTGSHSVNERDLRRTRWPYQTLFAVGYVVLLIYIFTIYGYFA
ncbi:hypothetical protein [Arthrobacter celericrescens]|uniref:hypothetical protein n=1 Tax=Arthrobacter celericrescens TaxID=2320851 RepID=UPI000EA00FD1|nr:hypothetical protein [Arthrobacter celericrescens]